MKYRRRKIKGVILALATAAVLVPAASGHVYEGRSTKAEAPGYSPQALRALDERWTKLAESYQQVRPDDRAGVRATQPVTVQSDIVDRQVANLEASSANALRPDNRVGIRGPGTVDTPAVVSAHGEGFDWTDAGIGASATLAAAVLLAAAAAATRRRTGLAV